MARQRDVLRQRIDSALPVVVSALVHVMLLAFLSFLVVPAIRQAGIWLDAQTDTSGELELEDLALTIDNRLEAPVPDDSTLPSFPELHVFEPPSQVPDSLLPEAAPDTVAHQPIVGDGGSLKRASSVEGAVDGITDAIRRALQKGDLSVVWLFDASHSLVDDRQRIALRLESFLTDTADAAADSPGQLSNTVVSFGTRMKERVRTTESRSKVVKSIKSIPVDPSGEENVFNAIAQCVAKYRPPSSAASLMLVVWTDESGDDVDQLEKVVELCRGADVPVHVVGPSAVLGADTGFHAYTDPKSELNYLLPVTRGPDSAIEERIRLGYWFQTRPPTRLVGRRGYRLPPWYGGRDLEGMSSGFSPFALTRLSIETGGSFTILDSELDRPPFELSVMKDYLPAYDAAADYVTRLEQYPLRTAVSRAVEATRGQRELAVPPLMLFGRRSEVPPFRFEAPYLEPSQFARKLRAERPVLIRQVARTSKLVEEALLHVSSGEDIDKGLDEWYAQETSPRWRAWYDLTRGRLLATSVRLEEYRLMCDQLTDRDLLQPSTNFIAFQATRNMKSGPVFQRRNEEALQLLTRCTRENSQTPWAYLAQRELDYAVGVAIQQTALRPTGAVPSQQPSLPRF